MGQTKKHKYDLIVIGAGPAGEKGAALAAYFGKTVALVERGDIGGAAVNTGTLPSKTLRETALYLSGLDQRGLYGVDYTFNREVTVDDLMYREHEIVRSHQVLSEQNIARHSIELFRGTATLEDAHVAQVSHEDGHTVRLEGKSILIATGSRPFHPPGVPFDGKAVYDSDSILQLKRIPTSLLIVGAGVIGCEYATLFGSLGIPVALIDNDDQFLPFLDQEIAEILMERMRALKVSLLFDRQVRQVRSGDSAGNIIVSFTGGDDLQADAVLFCIGRSGNVEELGLEHLGVRLGPHGCIEVSEHFQTCIPNIYAAGDVIGAPALAATSMEQARAAVSHAFGLEYEREAASLVPYGLYTIPEVSMVGATERSLREHDRPYLVGRGFYRQNPRAQIIGDATGLLKLLFDPESRRVLGVHIIGEQATELIHIGQS